MHAYVNVHLYRERERARERGSERVSEKEKRGERCDNGRKRARASASVSR